MSSDYYGFIAGEIADEGASGPPRDPDVCGVGYCEDRWREGDSWHDCGGYCGNCGIHLDEHGDRCNDVFREHIPCTECGNKPDGERGEYPVSHKPDCPRLRPGYVYPPFEAE